LHWYWAQVERSQEAPWKKLWARASALRRAGDRRARALVLEVVRNAKTPATVRADLLRWYAEVAPDDARALARHFLSSPDPPPRLRAAVLCLPTAHAAQAREALSAFLGSLRDGSHSDDETADRALLAVTELAADGTSQSLRAAARIFEGKALD